MIWVSTCDFFFLHIGRHLRLRRACASAQTQQNRRSSHKGIAQTKYIYTCSSTGYTGLYACAMSICTSNGSIYMKKEGERRYSLIRKPGQSKWIRPGNNTITHCRPTHGTARKSHRTLTDTRYQEENSKPNNPLSLDDCNTRQDTKYYISITIFSSEGFVGIFFPTTTSKSIIRVD